MEHTTAEQLIAAAERDIDSGWLPACQLAVARHNEVIAFETLGSATSSDRFLAFSCTKPIVAAAVWHLIADGRLDPAQRVGNYLDAFTGGPKQNVTVEDVFLHTAGFPNAPMSPTDGADRAIRRERISRWELDWEPGSRFEYHATSAHWVLADLIEELTGDDFRDFVDDTVCKPLGIPRVLGIPVAQQDHITRPQRVGAAFEGRAIDVPMDAEIAARPEVIAAGVPGGGAVMTAADLALFYQGLLHNPGDLWDPAVLADATSNIRCRLPEPLFGLAVNRTIGLVVAGDDGHHIMRYAGFGASNSPRSFGHAGMHMQVGWADPATGLSFAYLTNGVDTEVLREGTRGVLLADIAARLA